MYCIRVNEQIVLIDAMRYLLSHTCSTAEKTAINDAVDYFTSWTHKTCNKSVPCVVAVSDTCSADDEMILNVVKNIAVIGDTSSADQNAGARDSVNDDGCRDKGVDEKAAAKVAAFDVTRSMDETSTRSERRWKLLIKVHIRNKNVPHRFAVTWIDYWTVCHIYSLLIIRHVQFSKYDFSFVVGLVLKKPCSSVQFYLKLLFSILFSVFTIIQQHIDTQSA